MRTIFFIIMLYVMALVGVAYFGYQLAAQITVEDIGNTIGRGVKAFDAAVQND